MLPNPFIDSTIKLTNFVALSFMVWIGNVSTRRSSLCERNGYAGIVSVRSGDYCYRIEDNRLVGIAVSVLEDDEKEAP